MPASPSSPSLPDPRRPLEARMFRGRCGFRLRTALAQTLPLSRHALRRMSREGRAIPAELVRLVIRHGRVWDEGYGVRISLEGAPRPGTVPEGIWEAALPIVVPIDERGRIPTVFRRSRR